MTQIFMVPRAGWRVRTYVHLHCASAIPQSRRYDNLPRVAQMPRAFQAFVTVRREAVPAARISAISGPWHWPELCTPDAVDPSASVTSRRKEPQKKAREASK